MTNEVIETVSQSTISGATLFKDTIRPESPGNRLRKARESKRLTIEEMAKRLRYTPARVQELESDDYHLMGATAFARGYLRSYAGQLNFSKEEILDILVAFDQLELGASISGHKPQLIREEIKQVNPKLARRIGYGVAALVVILILTWWYASHSSSKPAANEAAPAAPAAVEATDANTPGKVQLEVVPLEGQGTAASNTGAMVDLPLPTLQPNRVSPTSREPLQTPSQSVPQTSTASSTSPAATKATTPKNVPAPVVAKTGG